MIFKKKNKSVQFFTAHEQVLVRAPITAAKETSPEWWKKLPAYVDFHTNQLPQDAVERNWFKVMSAKYKSFFNKTAKVCPGIMGAVQSGYNIPMWCELDIFFNHETGWIDWRFVNSDFKMEMSNKYPLLTNTNIAQGEKQFLVKLFGPWEARLPDGHEALLMPPLYGDYPEGVTCMPGTLRNDAHMYRSSLNAFLVLDFTDREHIRIPFGETLFQLIVYKIPKLKHKLNLVGKDEMNKYVPLKHNRDWMG
jgi:hypothetical protein